MIGSTCPRGCNRGHCQCPEDCRADTAPPDSTDGKLLDGPAGPEFIPQDSLWQPNPEPQS